MYKKLLLLEPFHLEQIHISNRRLTVWIFMNGVASINIGSGQVLFLKSCFVMSDNSCNIRHHFAYAT